MARMSAYPCLSWDATEIASVLKTILRHPAFVFCSILVGFQHHISIAFVVFMRPLCVWSIGGGACTPFWWLEYRRR